MYYSDVSCNVENSLNKLDGLGMKKFLSVDWMGIVTITNTNKIIIDGGRDYNNIGVSRIIKCLTEISKDMILLEEGKIYEILQNESNTNIMVSPIRVQDDYEVFYICCSIREKYTSKDLSILEFITEVTYENVLLNNEIIQERNYLQNIFNSTEASIISMGLDGVITTANRASLDVYGWIPEDIIGRKYYELLTQEESHNMDKSIEYVVKHNKTYYVKEVIFSNDTGEEKIVNLAISPLNDSKNHVVGVVVISRDITRLKIYERELEQAKQFAVLGELATGVAHDIRNPLMSIKGCANILKRSLLEQPKHMEFIEPIIGEVDRINDVVEQMLSYAMMTKENRSILLSINEVLEKCFKVIGLHRKSKHIYIEKNLSQDLPLIKGNNVQLQQAFINILMNGIEAIESEGIIKINSDYIKKEEKIGVSISDNGVGICPEEIEKIFTPFYSTKKKGIGFGLCIAKRAIERLHGDIKIKSKLDEGTTFEIYLPVRREEPYE
ncbi:two-component system sensor histidine kinase NtrB [Anaeromicrobium sediminis]|uniref:histidine kinase n=1 Tax=Anaeromicrobium sediminis TaxID=1478221 RepID=A0A267MQY6_9FIRM|nr:ATP-binding protein [Anaeromicrobium sediminis]PAB61183.1 hypothetical protein CCE28_01790 [Anaeromicrobium sediminis]